MHGRFTFLDRSRDEKRTRDPEFHRLSHGGAFRTLVELDDNGYHQSARADLE